MASRKSKKAVTKAKEETPAATAVAPEGFTAAQERQARAAKVQAEAEAKKLDETVPGGVYIVDGRKVNAHGEPIKAKKEEGEE